MRLLTPRSRHRIYGHRGSRLRAVENTTASFHLAVDEGAHGFETDVRRLADGILVLCHAEFVADHPVEELTYEELQRFAPDITRLCDLASIAAPGLDIIVEIKGNGFERQLVEETASFPSVILASFDHRAVIDLARLRDSSSTGVRVGAIVAGRLIDAARYVHDLGADWFLPASSFVDEELVVDCTQYGLAVVPWVLNHPSQWNLAVASGCQGFITDDPAGTRSWLVSSGVPTDA